MGFGYNNQHTRLMVQGFEKPVMEALRVAADRITASQADAALQRWFGDTAGAFKTQLARDILRMRSQVNVRNIVFGFETLNNRRDDTNASAWTSSKKVAFGDAMSDVPATAGSMVDLDLAFTGLPDYLGLTNGTIDASDYNQSKLNTIIHELSHLLVGTKDEDYTGSSGGVATVKVANGAKRSERLAAQSPAKAKTNAENWSVFVEAVGHHKAS